ncbi:hypothetical protein [Streptomyces sp. NPDC014746]|uniref:hypothetical protein n=1 Tax=Streptomyces sp. NPDC014746 TaxID=3364904 RepID=UPI0036F6968B
MLDGAEGSVWESATLTTQTQTQAEADAPKGLRRTRRRNPPLTAVRRGPRQRCFFLRRPAHPNDAASVLPSGRRRLPSAADKAKAKEPVSNEQLEAADRTDQAKSDVNQTGERIKDVVKN